MNENYNRLREEIDTADAIVIGAGAGLSTSAGFIYDGPRFRKYFSDFEATFGFTDMYTGGFYVERLSPEKRWAYMSRMVWVNRYMDPPKPLYNEIYELVKDKDYFVITTNVDHCFQKAGFDKSRLFYTQGDYGLLRCSKPCHQETYDNEEMIREMILSQGFTIEGDGTLTIPEGITLKMDVPSELIPQCPRCGEPMTINLRGDDKFVEDEGWHKAAGAYEDFLNEHEGEHVLFLELGVGGNTPVIIKYPFWRMTAYNPKATYACLNYGEAVCPEEIKDRSICINADIGDVIHEL